MYHPTPSAATRLALKSPAGAPPSSLYCPSPPPPPARAPRLLSLDSATAADVASTCDGRAVHPSHLTSSPKVFTLRCAHRLPRNHPPAPSARILRVPNVLVVPRHNQRRPPPHALHVRPLHPPPSPPSRSSACASNRTLFCAKPLLIFCEERRGTSWSAPQSCCSKTRAKTRPRPTRHSGRL